MTRAAGAARKLCFRKTAPKLVFTDKHYTTGVCTPMDKREWGNGN